MKVIVFEIHSVPSRLQDVRRQGGRRVSKTRDGNGVLQGQARISETAILPGVAEDDDDDDDATFDTQQGAITTTGHKGIPMDPAAVVINIEDGADNASDPDSDSSWHSTVAGTEA
jgi:hypothetical protein